MYFVEGCGILARMLGIFDQAVILENQHHAISSIQLYQTA